MRLVQGEGGRVAGCCGAVDQRAERASRCREGKGQSIAEDADEQREHRDALEAAGFMVEAKNVGGRRDGSRERGVVRGSCVRHAAAPPRMS
ncbi:transposase [Burkholderia ambifaria]